MKLSIDKKLSDFRDAVHHVAQAKKSRRNRDAELLDAVERVVEATDGRIRLVSGYKKHLLEVVGSSLEFANDLVNQIPPAIDISTRNFISSPYVNAFFSNPGDLQTAFSHSSEIRDFMEDCEHGGVEQCCALLCMEMTEKTVMGMELSGDMLKKDVRQIAVNFSDHRVYSPAPTEPETRQGLKQCLFGGLVTNALEHIVQLRLKNQRLQSERQILQARLRRCQRDLDEENRGMTRNAKVLREYEATRLKLERINKAARDLQPATPLESMKQIISVFGNPGSFVRLRKLSVRLNKMGIKLGANSKQACNILKLSEVFIGNERPRVITLANFPRQDLQPRQRFSATGMSFPATPM